MSWWNEKKKEELPESIRELSPEQIDQQLRDAKELKEKLEAAERATATKDTELSTLRGELQTVNTRIQELETKGKTPPADRNEIPSVLEDEDEAFNRRQAPIAAVAYHGAALAARQQAQNQIFRNSRERFLYNKYEDEIEDVMKREAPQLRAMPERWLTAFTYVKGLHTSEIAEKGSSFFSEESSGGPPPPEKKDDVLSEEEKKIAASMKVSEADYLKNKKSIHVVQG